MRRIVLGLIVLACFALTLPATAGAASKPYGKLDCAPQGAVRFCPGGFAPIDKRIKSFDGVPLDVDVTLPGSGDGPFPLLILLHGYGGNKTNLETSNPNSQSKYHMNNSWFASRGYAVITYTARGFVGSCGSAASRAADPVGCAKGWAHLDDSRFEARDAQFLAGPLVDEGLVAPKQIGVAGASYGGGPSLMLAALKDKVRATNGSLQPFRSPGGVAMQIAATAPTIAWSDLSYSLVPNGRSLDYALDKPGFAGKPTGVGKQSFVFGLYAAGLAAPGYYAPLGTAGADLTGWRAAFEAGEPATQTAIDSVRELSANHSSFPLFRSKPAPMFITTGFTDDLFPPIESLRAYNRVRKISSKTPLYLTAGDLGHMRGQNKLVQGHLIADQANRFLDAYLKGGSKPKPFAQAFTQTCPAGAAAGGPFRASTWWKLQRGQVRLNARSAQTVTATGGDPATAAAIDPVFGQGACVQVSAADAPGTANYRMRIGKPFTLLGLPTIDAKITQNGSFSELAARLWDVDPAGKATLVTRGVVRPKPGEKRLIFQLDGNAYRLPSGHTLKLELVGRDPQYLLASNNTTFSITVKSLKLYLPTHEKRGGSVKKPKPLPLPKGAKRAPR